MELLQIEDRDYTAEELENFPYRALQQLAKLMALPSNVKKVVLIEMITARSMKTPEEFDEIVHRVKLERRNRRIQKNLNDEQLNMEVTSSTNTQPSPRIHMTPKSVLTRVTHTPIITYKPMKAHTTSSSTSDRILRSKDVKAYKRPNYSLINNSMFSLVKAVEQAELKEAQVKTVSRERNDSRKTLRQNSSKVIKKRRPSVLDHIILRKDIIDQLRPAHTNQSGSDHCSQLNQAHNNKLLPIQRNQSVQVHSNHLKPARNIRLAPAPSNQLAPVPRNQLAPALRNQLAPALRNQLAPAPRNQMAPAPRNKLAPASRSQMTPVSRHQLTPTPRNQLVPAPRNQLTPVSRNQLAPVSRNQLAPASRNQLAPASRHQLAPAPRSQLAPSPGNQMIPVPRNQLTPTSRNHLVPVPRNQLTPTSRNHLAPVLRNQLPPVHRNPMVQAQNNQPLVAHSNRNQNMSLPARVYPARRKSRTISIFSFTSDEQAPSVGFRRTDGRISKINALVQKRTPKRRPARRSSHNVQVTIQDIINGNIDAQTFTTTTPTVYIADSTDDLRRYYPNMSSVTEVSPEQRTSTAPAAKNVGAFQVYNNRKAKQARKQPLRTIPPVSVSAPDIPYNKANEFVQKNQTIHTVLSTSYGARDVTDLIYVRVNQANKIAGYEEAVNAANEIQLPNITDAFSQINKVAVNPPLLHINGQSERHNVGGVINCCNCEFPKELARVYTYNDILPECFSPPSSKAVTESVYCAPVMPTVREQPTTFGTQPPVASRRADKDLSSLTHTMDEVSGELELIPEQEMTLRSYRGAMTPSSHSTESQVSQSTQLSQDTQLSQVSQLSQGSQLSQETLLSQDIQDSLSQESMGEEIDSTYSIPDMVEDALELISQDGDYMERINMDIRVQCILCSWAGAKIILENHIRKEHYTEITRQGNAEWNVTFALGSLAAEAIWVSNVSEYERRMYILSVQYRDPDSFMASLTTLSDADVDAKFGTITVYNKVTGEPFYWYDQIPELPPNMPYDNGPNYLTVELSKLDLLPNSANLILHNRSLVQNSPSKVIVGRPELNDIQITVFVNIHDW